MKNRSRIIPVVFLAALMFCFADNLSASTVQKKTVSTDCQKKPQKNHCKPPRGHRQPKGAPLDGGLLIGLFGAGSAYIAARKKRKANV
jgi:hypothetical protein